MTYVQSVPSSVALLCKDFNIMLIFEIAEYEVSEDKVDDHSARKPSACPAAALIHCNMPLSFSLLQSCFSNDSLCLLFITSSNDSPLFSCVFVRIHSKSQINTSVFSCDECTEIH